MSYKNLASQYKAVDIKKNDFKIEDGEYQATVLNLEFKEKNEALIFNITYNIELNDKECTLKGFYYVGENTLFNFSQLLRDIFRLTGVDLLDNQKRQMLENPSIYVEVLNSYLIGSQGIIDVKTKNDYKQIKVKFNENIEVINIEVPDEDGTDDFPF